MPHQPDEHGREQRKDIGLQERDQQLEEQHEQRKAHGSADHDVADRRWRGAEHEDQAEQHQNHEVAGRHVRKEPQRKRERLDEFPDQLDGRHDDRHDHGAEALHARRHHHDRLEVALRPEGPEAGDLDSEECGEREPRGDGDVAGGAGAPRQEAEQVAVENEEEERQDVRREDFAAVPNTRDGDVVTNEQHHRFDRGTKAAWGFPFAMSLIDLPAAIPDRDEDEERREDHEHHVLRRRDIDVRTGDEPGSRQALLSKPQQLDELAVAGVVEDHLADVRLLEHHVRNLVSRNKSGNNTPTYPSSAGTVRETIRTIPTPSSRIPIPPSQRAMNSGLGARIFGRSSATAQSCTISATPPPIAAGLPPSSVAATTKPIPSPARIARFFIRRPFAAPRRPSPPYLASPDSRCS